MYIIVRFTYSCMVDKNNARGTYFWMTFTMLSPTEGSASVAKCDPDEGSESDSGMTAAATVTTHNHKGLCEGRKSN